MQSDGMGGLMIDKIDIISNTTAHISSNIGTPWFGWTVLYGPAMKFISNGNTTLINFVAVGSGTYLPGAFLPALGTSTRLTCPLLQGSNAITFNGPNNVYSGKYGYSTDSSCGTGAEESS